MARQKVRLTQAAHAKGLPLPEYQTEHASGMDLCAAIDEELVVSPGGRVLVPTGLHIELPPGLEAQIRPRSGLAIKRGISMVNSPGTIDADYRGEIQVILINHGHEPFHIARGDRIAQMIVAPIVQIEWEHAESLTDSDRGAGGFGHTGV